MHNLRELQSCTKSSPTPLSSCGTGVRAAQLHSEGDGRVGRAVCEHHRASRTQKKRYTDSGDSTMYAVHRVLMQTQLGKMLQLHCSLLMLLALVLTFGEAVTVALLFSAVGGSGFGSGLQFLGPLSAETVSQTLGPFTNDRRRLCITMPITDDEMCGESLTESFSVQLTTDDPNVTLTPAAATLVIRDSPQCSETVCLVRKPVIYMYIANLKHSIP